MERPLPSIRARIATTLLTATAALGACALAAPAADAAFAPQAYALSGTDLVSFDPGHPTAATTTAITGVNANETLVGLTFRPQNGALYALGVNATANTGTLYVVGPTGYASVVGTAGAVALTTDGSTPVDLPSADYGVDFAPNSDRLRVVADTLNFRINPNTGIPVDGDNGGGVTTGINPDGPIHGVATSVSGVAYTNSATNLATATTAYTLSAATDQLLAQNPPNAGNEVFVADLHVGITPLAVSAVGGFDLDPAVAVTTSNTAATSGDGYAILTVYGVTHLYKIGLVDGAATDLGPIGAGTGPFRGLALQRDVVDGGLPAVGLSSDGTTLRRMSTGAPGTAITQAINLAPLQAGESLVALAWRSATGQLLGLAVNATNDTGTLYLVDPQTGALTAIGVGGSVAWQTSGGATVDLPAASAGWGIDVNPTVDRVRVVAGNGLNARINPNTGVPVDGDAIALGIQPDANHNNLPLGATGVASVAYTNAFAQPLTGGTTTLYVLEATSDQLLIQSPANAGVLTAPKAVTLNGARLDFGLPASLDLPPEVKVSTSNTAATGEAIAALVAGGTPGVYAIDLTSGAATLLGTLPTPLAALAVGNAHRTPPTLVSPPPGGGGGGTGATPPPPVALPNTAPVVDRRAPRVTKLSVKARTKKRLTITFTTDEAGTARVELQRLTPGRRTSKRKCVAGRKKGARCTLYKTYKTVRKAVAKPGTVTIATTGRTGAVRVLVVVRDQAGNASKAATRAAKVKR